MAGSMEGVSDDDHIGASDNPRNGQLGEAQANAGEIEEAGPDDAAAPPDGLGDPQQRELKEVILSKIEQMGSEEFVSLLFGVQSTSWSGLLPPPDSFNKYPDYVQEHMVAWNDAQIIEAAELDRKLVDAEVKQASNGQRLSFALNIVFAALSFAAFMATGNVVSFGFLAIPGISVVFNIVKDERARKEDDARGGELS